MRTSWLIPAVLIGLTGCSTTMVEASSPVASAVEGISVTGQGEARGQPDIARVTLGVEVCDQVAQRATERASEQLAAVIETLRDEGVAENDMRTVRYNVHFERDFSRPPPPPPPRGPASEDEKERGELPSSAGGPVAPTAASTTSEKPPRPVQPRGFYRVNNSIEVTLRELDSVGDVLAAALQAGANSVDRLSFELEDTTELEQQARQQAMQNAERAATHLASLSGTKKGPILSVSESSGGPRPVQTISLASAERAEVGVPVQPGEITVTLTVHVVYGIER